MSVIDQVKVLNDAQLYDDVKMLTSFLLTMSDQNADLLSITNKYHTLVYQADAYYYTQNYKKAESIYYKALQVKKLLNKTKGKSPSIALRSKGEAPRSPTHTNPDPLNEVEVKYRLHMCHIHQKQNAEATVVLEGITSKQRTTKIHLALAHLYQKSGNDRSAVTGYKEVLRECPMSTGAAHGLLSLGVSGPEVAALMMNSLTTLTSVEWLSLWIKAQAFVQTKEFPNAVQTFKLLDNKLLLRDNVDLLCCLGEAQFLAGNYMTALATLQRAHLVDPYLLRNMDILAYLYMKEKKSKELFTLGNKLMSISEQGPEPWIAMGYFCIATKKASRAVYFGQKAITFGKRTLESLLLKGLALLEMKRHMDALQHFREAVRICPHRYEAHRGLMDCYLATQRMREVINYAGASYKQLGTNPRSLTLYAGILAKGPLSLEKAKTFLEKAMKMDSNYLDAVYVMAEILEKQQHYDRGIHLLRQYLRQHNTYRLHQLLGDFLGHVNEHQESLDQYIIALRLDPTNPLARAACERVEKHSPLAMDSTFDVEVDDMEGTDNENEFEGSDLEGGWSDVDVI